MIKNNLIIQSCRFIYDVLGRNERVAGAKLLILLFFNSIFEIIGLAAFLPLFTIILSEQEVGYAGVVGDVYNYLGFSDNRMFVIFVASVILFVFILKNIASLYIVKKQASFSLGLFQRFSLQMHRYYYEKGFLYLKGKNSNEVYRDINYIPQRFSENVVLPIFQLINEAVVVLLIAVGLMLYDYRVMGLLLVFVLPIIFIFYNIVKNRISALESQVNGLMPKLGNSIYQSIFGYTDIVLSGKDSYYRAIVGKYLAAMVDAAVRRTVYKMAPTKVLETGMVLAIFILISFGVFMFDDRAQLISVLGLFALGGYRLLPSMNRILIATLSVKGHQFTFDGIRLASISIEKELDLQDGLDGLDFSRDLRFSDLSFTYPGSTQATLESLNLVINKGETIGIVGPSGSGKTTVMNLLLGLIEPTGGRFEVDGKSVLPDNLLLWQHKISCVQQDVYLFDGSVAQNIALGVPDHEIDVPKLRSVLAKASLLDVVDALPGGIQAQVGERGAKLSRGQCQRLGIARALYSDTEVLLFDEATSALDNETEQAVTESIAALRGSGLTMVIIAHRLTTLKDCDRVIEIKGGSSVREMSYQEMIMAQ